MTSTNGELAAVLHSAGDLRVEQITRERLRPGAVRVEVGATGLCGSDLHYYADGRNGPNVLRSPTVLGHEAAGVVTDLGRAVTARFPLQRADEALHTALNDRRHLKIAITGAGGRRT